LKLLLDTHIWIWYVLGSEDLPSSLRSALDDAIGRCWLAPISLWETSLLIRKGRFRIDGTFQDWVEQALETVPMREAAFSFDVARRVDALTLPHHDPADHFITATALVYGLTLVTLDQNLVDASWLPTLTR
jgi:PIN domain nuclease of toxin-antitoxin system